MIRCPKLTICAIYSAPEGESCRRVTSMRYVAQNWRYMSPPATCRLRGDDILSSILLMKARIAMTEFAHTVLSLEPHALNANLSAYTLASSYVRCHAPCSGSQSFALRYMILAITIRSFIFLCTLSQIST